MVTVAVIPARGGSRRIPHKNIVEFSGRPLIDWTIDAALESNCFDAIIVSTDDPAIATLATRPGVQIHARHNFADSVSPASLATLDALSVLDDQEPAVRRVAQLLPSCPLRNADDVRGAVDAFVASDSHSQISCAKFGFQPIWWAHVVREDGSVEPVFPEHSRSRSQDLPETFCPSGAIWISEIEALRRSQTFYSDGFTLHELSWESAFDIDTLADLKIARRIHSPERQSLRNP